MSRLTEYHCGVAVIKNKELLKEAMEKLAHYEDLEDDGRIVEIPCKVGEMLYVVGTKCLAGEPTDYWCSTHACDECIYDKEYVVFMRVATDDFLTTILLRKNLNFVFGKTVFRTKEEAEKALEEMRESNG